MNIKVSLNRCWTRRWQAEARRTKREMDIDMGTLLGIVIRDYLESQYRRRRLVMKDAMEAMEAAEALRTREADETIH